MPVGTTPDILALGARALISAMTAFVGTMTFLHFCRNTLR